MIIKYSWIKNFYIWLFFFLLGTIFEIYTGPKIIIDKRPLIEIKPQENTPTIIKDCIFYKSDSGLAIAGRYTKEVK